MLASIAVVMRSDSVRVLTTTLPSCSMASWNSFWMSGICTKALVRAIARQRVVQSVDHHEQLEHLPLEVVQPLHRTAAGLRKDVSLDFEHVAFETIERGAIVVDHSVHDRRHHCGDAEPQLLMVGLERRGGHRQGDSHARSGLSPRTGR